MHPKACSPAETKSPARRRLAPCLIPSARPAQSARRLPVSTSQEPPGAVRCRLTRRPRPVPPAPAPPGPVRQAVRPVQWFPRLGGLPGPAPAGPAVTPRHLHTEGAYMASARHPAGPRHKGENSFQ